MPDVRIWKGRKIEGIVLRQNKGFNTDYIIERLTPLCDLKESPEIIEKLKSFFSDLM